MDVTGEVLVFTMIIWLCLEAAYLSLSERLLSLKDLDISNLTLVLSIVGSDLSCRGWVL